MPRFGRERLGGLPVGRRMAGLPPKTTAGTSRACGQARQRAGARARDGGRQLHPRGGHRQQHHRLLLQRHHHCQLRTGE